MKTVLNNIRIHIGYEDDGHLVHTDKRRRRRRHSARHTLRHSSQRRRKKPDIVEPVQVAAPPSRNGPFVARHSLPPRLRRLPRSNVRSMPPAMVPTLLNRPPAFY